MSVPGRRPDARVAETAPASGAIDQRTMEEELKDGICPECGEYLQFWGENGHELNDGDYLTPNTFVTESYTYKCPNCGAIYETKNAL